MSEGEFIMIARFVLYLLVNTLVVFYLKLHFKPIALLRGEIYRYIVFCLRRFQMSEIVEKGFIEF
jgi:hypothetical protein